MELPELYRSSSVLVVNKPSGLAVHRGLCRDKVTVSDLISAHTVHRLDRPTSGALLLALDPETARRFTELWPSVVKTYLCVTRGDPGDGVISHPIPKDEGAERVPALSRYQTLARFERYALVRVVPENGRFHQVRRHMKHLSCPLIGDTTYGKSEHNRIWQARFGLARLALHCESLTFEGVTVIAPLPEDLAAPIAQTFSLDPIQTLATPSNPYRTRPL